MNPDGGRMSITGIVMLWLIVPCLWLWGQRHRGNSIQKMCWESVVVSCRTSLLSRAFHPGPLSHGATACWCPFYFVWFILIFTLSHLTVRRKIHVSPVIVYAQFHQQWLPTDPLQILEASRNAVDHGERDLLLHGGMLCCTACTASSQQPIYSGNVCTSLAGQIQSPVLQTFLLFSAYLLLVFKYLLHQAPTS